MLWLVDTPVLISHQNWQTKILYESFYQVCSIVQYRHGKKATNLCTALAASYCEVHQSIAGSKISSDSCPGLQVLICR